MAEKSKIGTCPGQPHTAPLLSAVSTPEAANAPKAPHGYSPSGMCSARKALLIREAITRFGDWLSDGLARLPDERAGDSDLPADGLTEDRTTGPVARFPKSRRR